MHRLQSLSRVQSIQAQISQITTPLMAAGGSTGSGSDGPSDDAASFQCVHPLILIETSLSSPS